MKNLNRFFDISPFAILFIYLLMLIFANEKLSKSIELSLISVALIISTIGALVTKKVGLRAYGTIIKSDNPQLYWQQTTILLILSVLSAFGAFITYK
jgi:hypothetical protein